MSKNKDKKGKFIEGNVAARKKIPNVEAVMSEEEERKLEKELKKLQKTMEAHLKTKNPAKKLLLARVVNLERNMQRLNWLIKSQGASVDPRHLTNLLKLTREQRLILRDLKLPDEPMMDMLGLMKKKMAKHDRQEAREAKKASETKHQSDDSESSVGQAEESPEDE